MSKKFLTLETYRAFAALMIAAIHFDFFSVLVGLLFIIIIEIRLKIIQILKYL